MHNLDSIAHALDRIEQTQREHGRMLRALLRQEATMALDFSRLLRSTAQNTDAVAAITAAFKAIAEGAPDEGATQAEIDAYAASIDANSAKLAEMALANTPHGPAVPPASVPPAVSVP